MATKDAKHASSVDSASPLTRKSTSAGSAAPLTRTDSFQYPNAHYNHLSEAQSQKLQEFKQLAQQHGYFHPKSSDRPRASHDDETLLRYLRARKFVPADAFKQFKDTEDWRRDNEIDKLYDTIDVDEYDETRRLYPQWTGRRDKRGIPVYVFEIAGLNSKRMSAYQSSLSSKAAQHPSKGNISPNLRRLFALYENLIQFVLPLCSAIPNRPYSDTPVSQSNNIVDISKTGLKQFWNLKGHMQEASQLATAHYPETLDRIFILGAPSFFPTVWSWIKRWFDPITVSKIFILTPANTYKTLSEYIEPQNIPKKYGGELEWEWGHLPNIDPEISSTLDWKKPGSSESGSTAFPVGPIRWRTSADGHRMSAIALGSVSGRQREEEIASIPISKDLALDQPLIRPPAPIALASFSGEHTHPSEDVDAFPTTGDTPADTPTGSDAQSMSSSSKLSSVGNRSVAVQQTDASRKPSGQQAPHPATERQNQIREGTSSMRQDQQSGTHAEGIGSHATPAVVDQGHGDKTRMVEPGTIGQAPKDVTVPEKTEDSPRDSTYIDQAKTVVDSAAATVGEVGSGIANKLNISSQNPASKEQEGRVMNNKRQDAEVDKLGDVEVEDFIRSKYASHDNPSTKLPPVTDDANVS